MVIWNSLETHGEISRLRMPFKIGQHIIPFGEYQNLAHHRDDYPIVQDIIRLMDTWEEDKELIVKTSGSTGTPKQIILPRQSVIHSAQLTIDFFGISPQDTMLLALPVTHIAGIMMVIRSLVANCTLVITQPSSSIIQPHSKTKFLALTPHQFLNSYEEDETVYKRVEKILLGGAPSSPACNKVANDISAQVFHGYGMTETITHIALRQIGSRRSEIYKALPGVEFSVDDNMCLCIKATHLSEEIKTTDVVELLNEKEMVWKGRRDNVINSGGIKIHPEKIEQIFTSVLKTNSLIIPIPDERLGQKLGLLIEGEPMKLELHKEDLPALDKYEIPKYYSTMAVFDRTESGKIDRRKCIQKAQRNNTFERLLIRE